MLEFILILLILFIGSFLQGTSGFGFGLFCMGLLPFFLPLKSCTLLVLALTIIISLNIVLKLREFVKIKDTLVILSFALVGRIFSFFFLNQFGDLDLMKMILGFVLIGTVFYLNMKKKEVSLMSFHRIYYEIIIGIVGGFIGGVFAVGGPFFVLYFLMVYREKNIYNANLQFVFVCLNIFSTILHGLNGDFNHALWLYLILGIVVVLIGVNLGLKWFQYLPNNRIKKLASVIVLFAAFNLIFLS
jgi:uncharacterized protein